MQSAIRSSVLGRIGILAAGLGIGLVALTSIASADSPRPHRGDVMNATPDTFSATWVTGTSSDGGAKGQSLAMTDFAFYSFRNWWDQNLADVTKVRTDWLLSGTNSGGSPRFSFELDLPGNGIGTVATPDGDVVVYLDPATCSDPATNGWVSSDFTGDRTNCTINDSLGGVYTSDESGTAWSKLVAAYPGAKVWFMFLIQDASTGTNYVDRIMLDSAFFTKQP